MTRPKQSSAAANTDPVSYRCGWCGRRLRRSISERPGYWWYCSDPGHPYNHDPRRRGLAAAWHAFVARFQRPVVLDD